MDDHGAASAQSERIARGDDAAVDPDAVEPTNTVTGVVPRSGDASDVVDKLTDAGIASERIRRLEGEAGVEAIDPGGTGVVNALGKLLSEATEYRDDLIDALERGRCAIMVTDVDDDSGHDLKQLMQDAGLERVHHFGEWMAE